VESVEKYKLLRISRWRVGILEIFFDNSFFYIPLFLSLKKSLQYRVDVAKKWKTKIIVLTKINTDNSKTTLGIPVLIKRSVTRNMTGASTLKQVCALKTFEWERKKMFAFCRLRQLFQNIHGWVDIYVTLRKRKTGLWLLS
jgi:hypothetical protein